MAVVILTTGVPGCGKTYVRAARFLVDDFLINTRGVHWSNFPLEVDTISFEVSEKLSRGFFRHKKVSFEDIKKRIQVIPDDELQRWRREESGPWEYFRGVNLKYAHIAIDEIHNFISPSKSSDYLKLWDEFLGEVRHRGCTFEGVTQDILQVGQVLKGRAAVRLELVPAEDLRDPWFKIKMSDWYELKASLTGFYHKTVFEFEKRKMLSGWKTNHCRRFLITPEYFKFYRSYEASLQEKETETLPSLPSLPWDKKTESTDDNKVETEEDRTPLYEYQKRSRLSLLGWFLRRNWFTLFWRLGLAGFVFWLCFCGGLNILINGWLVSCQKIQKANRPKSVATKAVLSVAPSPPSSSAASSAKISASDLQKSINADLGQGRQIQSQIDNLSALEDLSKPAMFFDGKCWLRSGIKIYVGYEFKQMEGVPYEKSKKVVRIDPIERSYELDNGDIVYMY